MRNLLSIVLAASLCACNTVAKPAEDVPARFQLYDHRSNLRPAIAPQETCTAAHEQALINAYARPEMMAVGDSLYNGVQSLKIDWWLSEWSAPTFVAIRLGLVQEKNADRTGRRTFFGPQYPEHGSDTPPAEHTYGFDLERLPGGVLVGPALQLSQLPQQQANLLEDLAEHYTPPNGRILVDNIAFSGANSVDIANFTAGDFRREGATQRSGILKGRLHEGFDLLGDAFTFSNAAFVLNPMRDACVAKWTPLDHVIKRRPTRLLINIGANNGIFKVAFFGKRLSDSACDEHEPSSSSGVRRCKGDIRSFLSERLVDDVEVWLAEISKVDDIRDVYLNGVALPSRPANMILRKTRHGPVYKTAFAFKQGELPQGDVEAADAQTALTNAEIRREVDDANAKLVSRGKPPKFHFVDTDAAFARYDYKGCLGNGGTVQSCAGKRVPVNFKGLRDVYYLDNRPLKVSGASRFRTGAHFNKVVEGGLQSFDNMHLSSVGYEVMAGSVVEAMEAAKDPGLDVPRDASRCDNNPPRPNQAGDCIDLLLTPGWSYADYTRRSFLFLRTGGTAQVQNRETLSFILKFLN